MITFLRKISELEGIHNVILLSTEGHLLYGSLGEESEIHQRLADIWNALFQHLQKPPVIELIFERGLYYLRSTDVGYLIVCMTNSLNLEKIKNACSNIQAKLADSQIRKKVLLQLLSSTQYALKPNIIRELIPLADREVGAGLAALLQKEHIFPAGLRQEILLSICQAIGHCGSGDVVAPLKNFLQEYEKNAIDESDVIAKAARISIAQLELEKHAKDGENVSENINNTSQIQAKRQPDSLSMNRELHSDRSAEEQQIADLLAQNDKDQAITLLLQLVEKTAHKREFSKAEKMRDWLIEIDSMALTEIIRAAEIIEEEKISSVNVEHLEIWKKLVDMMTEEEFSSLYHSMKLKNYKAGTIIAHQGDFFSRLLFVNSGRIQLYTEVDGKETILKTIGQGEAIGGSTFFEASVWTVNVKSLGAELFLLSRLGTQHLLENYPSIESKLIDFCALFDTPISIFTNSRRTRRRFERKPIGGRATIVILDKNGNKSNISFKGDLFDISKGGVSFCLRVSRKKNATMLFGKKIHITIPMTARKASIVKTGVILAVRGHHVVSNEYSVHVEFDELLGGVEMQHIS